MKNSNARPRLLIFDLLRILAIFMIVCAHIGQAFGIIYFMGFKPVFQMFYFSIGALGVFLFIFISGAVLEYSHLHILTFIQYLKFIYNRFIRIYPAFWLSLIFGFIINFFILKNKFLLNESIFDIFWEISGMTIYHDPYMNYINPIGWFIGLIIPLYLLFPIISAAMKKNPFITLLSMIIFGFLSTYLINQYVFNVGGTGARWYPICNFAYFALGIFLVQMKFYPTIENTSKIIIFLSDLAFYVFLTHYVLLFLCSTNMLNPINLPIYVITVGISSIALKLLDEIFQNRFLKKGLSNGSVEMLRLQK